MVPGLSDKKILITGATGFIGANLANYLVKQGLKVDLMSRENSLKWRLVEIQDKVNLHQVDLKDAKKLKSVIQEIKPKIIFHCATYGGYPYQDDKDEIINTNIVGTVNLLNACEKIKFDCFVNTGTSSEYGIKTKAMKETDQLEPITNYGVAKAAATLFCQTLARRQEQPIVTLRLFSPYGYYEEPSRLIPSVITSCLLNEDPELSSPGSVRDFIFIDDVIGAYIKAVEKIDKFKGEILNIANGQEHTVKEVVDKVMELTATKAKPRWKGRANPRKEPAHWQADISLAQNKLGFKPKYNLEQGLQKTINWFKENIKLYEHEKV